MALLSFTQYQALVEHREAMMRAEALLRSADPEHWTAAYSTKRLREKIENRWRGITAEEVIRVFAGLRRQCSVLGPGSQEALQGILEPVIEQMGLGDAVSRAADALALAGSGRGRV